MMNVRIISVKLKLNTFWNDNFQVSIPTDLVGQIILLLLEKWPISTNVDPD